MICHDEDQSLEASVGPGSNGRAGDGRAGIGANDGVCRTAPAVD
jgi:hypothetical protein